MTKQDIEKMVQEEERRLGVGSADFLQRHEEIMQQCQRAAEIQPHMGQKGEKDGKTAIDCAGA